MTDETIDPDTLDTYTLRQVKKVIEAYPVVSSETPYHQLNDYRAGKRDGFTTVVVVIEQWLNDIE